MNATTSSSPALLLFVVTMVTAFVLLIHSALTSIEVPENLLADCAGAQVLDPETMTCGGQ